MTLPLFKKVFWVVLLPLSVLWAVLMFLRRKFSPTKNKFEFKTPILCVGNLHSGGSGKTPFLLEIAKRFKQTHQVVVLSRGYRSQISKEGKGAWVDLTQEKGANQFGDEPWMMANRLGVPVYIEKKREKAIPIIENKYHPSLILMDDGFQYLKLRKTFQVILISAQKKPEDSFCLPLGELREPMSAIREAQAVVLTASEKEIAAVQRWKEFLKSGSIKTPLFVAQREVEGVFEGSTPISTPNEPFGVFSGIASSKGFQEDIRKFVGEFQTQASFADHFKYSQASLNELKTHTQNLGLGFWLTTDKDWYKIKPQWKLPVPLYSLRIQYKIDPKFWELIKF